MDEAAGGSANVAAPPLTISRPELLIDDSDRHFRRLVHGLFGFLARHEAIRVGHAACIGLGGVEYTVLISISHLAADGDVSVKDVAAHLHVSGAFVTTVTGKLVRKGLVDKQPDPADRRRVRLTVTEHGQRRLAKLAPVQRQVNDVEFACLDRPQFLLLLDIVDKLIDCGDRAVALQAYLSTGTGAGDGAARRRDRVESRRSKPHR
jgi:DNA-binding MarR family transcriptional regulator